MLSPEGALPTYGASIAVDYQGGIHAAYAIYTGSEEGKQPAIYAYCPRDPGNRTNWSFIRIGEAVQEVRLALDPAGHPRLLLFGPKADPQTSFRMQYQYATCDNGWTNEANWTLATLATPIEAVGTREANNNRYFAISAQGETAFVYTDTLDNNHPGSFYMSCPGGCTNLANWTETTLTASFAFDKPSLAFSPQGKPRLAFGLFYDGELYLAYSECSGTATNSADWSVGLLSLIHGSAMYSLQSDSNGYPRLAFSSGSYASAPFTDHQLYYLWCTNGVTTDAANWNFNNVGFFQTSGAVDLALDRYGRPRISCLVAEGLGFAWCNTNAESAAAVWQRRTAESNASLAANYEVLPIQHCTVSTWIDGQRSCLALDPAGNPFIGHDAQHIWSGLHTDPPWDNCYFQDITITRLTFFPINPFISARRSGSQVELAFGNGFLESASTIAGPWAEVGATNSPLYITPDEPRRFFRIRP